MAAVDSNPSVPLKSTYTCTGATVEGLPTRSVFKSEGKYFVRISIDEQGGWETRENRTKGTRVVWDAEEDKHEFECTPTSALQVTLCKNHSHPRSVEEVGSVALPLNKWTEALMVARLVTGATAKDAASITVRLSLTQKDAASPESDVALREPAETAEASGTATGTTETGGTATDAHSAIPGLDAAKAAVDELENAAEDVIDIGGPLNLLLGRLDAFARRQDVSEVHPFVKMSRSILSAVLTAAGVQQNRKNKLKDLIEKMYTVYEFLCDAQELRDDKARKGVLSRLALQTVDCAHFISSCIQDTDFITRLMQHSVSGVSDKIDEYSRSFDDLFQDSQNGSQGRTEVATTLILDDIRDLAVDFDLRDIPYAGGAGYEPSKQCLQDTRTDLLEEISNWAIDDAEDTPGLFILMGRAGTGKSTIAHTMAARFRKMQRLGASFCFSTSSTRKPVNLFRNIARDLASFHPSFKLALRIAFILEPAKSLAVNGTVLIMVDAVDESGTTAERRALLTVLRERLQERPTPFRVLISSREEVDIQKAFPKSTGYAVVRRMPTLQEDTQLPSDILKYVQHSLSDNGVLLPGLSHKSCSTLAKKSEGLFQWAFVACDYIARDQIGESPCERFDIIIHRGDTGLDSLYRAVLSQILQPGPNHVEPESRPLHCFRTIMGTVLTAVEPLSMESLRSLFSFLPEESVDVFGVLRFLGSLLSGVGADTVAVRPLHSSFAEMLRSRERGDAYYIHTDGHQEKLVTASLRLLRSRLHFNMGDLETSYMLNRAARSSGQLSLKNVTEDLTYACRHWGYHLSMCAVGYEHEVFDLVLCLFKKNFLFWLDAASVAEIVSDVANCMTVAMARLENLGDSIFEMAHDGVQFLAVFAPVILESVAHIYLSALVWAPSKLTIATQYRSVYEQIPLVASGQVAWWPAAHFTIFTTSGIRTVAFSPDGRRIMSGSRDGTVRVWDAHTGEPVGEPLTGHDDSVGSVAFSPDGKRIVSGSDDGTVRVWDAHTGEPVGEPLTGHDGSVSSVAFSPNGTCIVSGSEDRTVRIWNTQNDSTSQLSLSPRPEHQLKQPYKSATSSENRISFDRKTGWFMGNNTDHIFWVPQDRIRRLYTGQTEFVILGPTIHVDLSKFVHGTQWTDCRLPLP